MELLKNVAGYRGAARAKGTAARKHIRSHFTWEQTADAVEQRLRALAGAEGRNETALPGLPACEPANRHP